MICDGQGCSVIAHLNCYFSAGSQDANDTISDIEHWHCEKCGGLPRHMHPRPRAAKRARVSFDPDLVVLTDTLITKGGFATGLQGGGWGGHWPIRTEMPQPTTGKGKEAMEHPIITRKRTREALSASFTLQPDQDAVVETTTCHFCRRADRWLYLTCGVCQLITHAKCYYRLGSDEATYYETNTSDWRCQDCGGPQRHGDCVLPHAEQAGGAAGPAVTLHSSALRLDQESEDRDMPDLLNADLLPPPRPHTLHLSAPAHVDMPQATASRATETLATNPCGLVDVGAPARSRRGPRKSGDHRKSTKNNGARAPDRK